MSLFKLNNYLFFSFLIYVFNRFFFTFLLFVFLNYWQTVGCQNRESLSQLLLSKNVTPEKHKLITNVILIWERIR